MADLGHDQDLDGPTAAGVRKVEPLDGRHRDGAIADLRDAPFDSGAGMIERALCRHARTVGMAIGNHLSPAGLLHKIEIASNAGA